MIDVHRMMTKVQDQKDALLFRRQYVIGSSFIPKLPGWKHLVINNQFHVTAHPELETAQVQKDEKQLTLLGYMFDPQNPYHSNEEILQDIMGCISDFEDVILQVDRMGGRFVLIYNDVFQVKILHDPCGLRQVFYTVGEREVWCGAQPEILQYSMEKRFAYDDEALEFIKSPQYEKTERVWPGDGTIYKNVKHLMPNHYLDAVTGETVRFWPRKRLEPVDIQEAVRTAKEVLQNSIKAAEHRYSLMLSVSAGWDSRTLLAASKDVRHKIFYYVSKYGQLSADCPDIRVPRRLLDRLGLDFHVLDCNEEMDEEFAKVLENNVTMARSLPKTRIIYRHFKSSQGKLNICGNASEIARKCIYTHYYKKKITASFLAQISFLKGCSYAISHYDKWLQEVRHFEPQYGINLYDLHYWEQRIGTWGAMYPAEQDIAIEEFWPYNNRKLLTTIMSVEEKYRKPPHYILFRELIKEMWDDTLSEPINPMDFVESMKKRLRRAYVTYILR
ncbi:MAG TPA: hypothetical protein VE710_20590 [Candidatus Bathyarchaeia archaeon]|nr:hypothetical protein [Candidatus Bathyarchaeia archaeon]